MDMQRTIAEKLAAELAPAHLQVEDESHMHSVPAGAQSHFKVTIVADAFAGEPLVARHRRVFAILSAELAGPVHALAVHALSPDEWRRRAQVPDSPPCHGGSKAQPAAS